jgi:2-haloacid dehalogenase
MNRREFLDANVGIATGMLLGAPAVARDSNPRFKAVAFDAFPIFDPRPIAALAETLFPGNGASLSNAWRIRQFEYAWLRTITGRYSDFMRVTDDALVFAAKALELELASDKRDRLLAAYLELKTWPDVVPALRTLKTAGVGLALLSNFTPSMLNGCIEAAGIDRIIDHVLSADTAQSYKPHPRAYQLGIDAFNLRREEILFVAFAGWDAAGAKSFGYPTYWVNRLGLPPEELGVLPDAIGSNLTDLLNYVDS